MKTVAFVPIRLNSSRVAGKNLRQLGGRPLMTYILQTLLQVHNIDATYVYCSDTSIAPLLPAGVTLLQRDTSLDSDTTLGEQIYDAFTREVQADIYVLAHATSPFIRPATIEEAVARVQSGECDSAFSAERIQTFAWYGGQPLNYSLTHVPRTQELEPVYAETSAFFVFGRDVWCKHHRRIGEHPYVAVTDRIESTDIDNPDDFTLAEAIVAAGLNK